MLVAQKSFDFEGVKKQYYNCGVDSQKSKTIKYPY